MIKGAKTALSVLTLIPVRFSSYDEVDFRGSVAWYPLVGLLVGLPGFFIAMLFQWVLEPTTIGLLVVVAGALVTRMMHWDALADVADAWWGGQDTESRQKIMSDSFVGSFGVTAIVLTALGLFLAVSHLVTVKAFAYLIVAPILGRTAPLFGAWLGVPAKSTGLGASVCSKPTALDIIVAVCGVLFAVALALLSSGPIGLFVVAASVLAIGAIPHFVSARMGGITGDVLGVGIVLGELIVYAFALLLGV